jgi:hypothetical protein
MKNRPQWCEKNLINNIKIRIHHNRIEMLLKEVCDEWPPNCMNKFHSWKPITNLVPHGWWEWRHMS